MRKHTMNSPELEDISNEIFFKRRIDILPRYAMNESAEPDVEDDDDLWMDTWAEHKVDTTETTAREANMDSPSVGYCHIGMGRSKVSLTWVKPNTDDKFLFTVEGVNAMSIYKQTSDFLDEFGFKITAEHGMYIGRELERAVNAMHSGGEYIQESVNTSPES